MIVTFLLLVVVFVVLKVQTCPSIREIQDQKLIQLPKTRHSILTSQLIKCPQFPNYTSLIQLAAFKKHILVYCIQEHDVLIIIPTYQWESGPPAYYLELWLLCIQQICVITQALFSCNPIHCIYDSKFCNRIFHCQPEPTDNSHK